MTPRPTRWMARQLPGAAALVAGGVGLVGLVLVHVAMGAPPVEMGMAAGIEAPLSPVRLHVPGGGAARVVPLPTPSTRGREALRVSALPDPEAAEALVRPRSELEWRSVYRGAELAELADATLRVLAPGCSPAQQVGLLLALEERDAAAASAAYLKATRLPEVRSRGLSVPAFSVMHLAGLADLTEARAALSELAFGSGPRPCLRLRAQATAALVTHTPEAELYALAERLAHLSESRLLASARGAARSLPHASRIVLEGVLPSPTVAP